MKKGYFLKCEGGCKDNEGKGLVMFWSDRTSEWQHGYIPQIRALACNNGLGWNAAGKETIERN